MNIKRYFSALCGLLTVAVVHQAAVADPINQNVLLLQQESGGERSLVFSCFYECKEGPTVQGTQTWQEVTTVIMANQSNRTIDSKLAFLDGNQRMIAQANNVFSGEDIDEVNVCRTLQSAGIQPPKMGLLEVVLEPNGSSVNVPGDTNKDGDVDYDDLALVTQCFGNSSPLPLPCTNADLNNDGVINVDDLTLVTTNFGKGVGGVYGWVKNLTGKFFKTIDEPFQGRVDGIGKADCRMAPRAVTTRDEVMQKINNASPPEIPLVLIEGTNP